jgi:hypothetical protein
MKDQQMATFRQAAGMRRPRFLRVLSVGVILAFVMAVAPEAHAQEPDTSAGSVDVQAPESRCMERHMREAAALNKARMPLYDSLTDGRSRGISRRLIWTERLAIPAAWWVDWRARQFQREGIRIVCDDFVPMARTPAFRARAAQPPQPLSAFVPADARRIRRGVDRALRRGGFPAASQALTRELRSLERTPAYHCMLRHLLESALRISSQAPRYAAEAQARGLLASPAELSRTMLDLHLAVLADAARLDRRAAPLQAEGIPILCQDVPPIPPLANP